MSRDDDPRRRKHQIIEAIGIAVLITLTIAIFGTLLIDCYVAGVTHWRREGQ